MVGDPTLNSDFSIDLFPDFNTPDPGSMTASSGSFLEQAINPSDAALVSASAPAFDPLSLATNALAVSKVIAAPTNFATGLPDTALAKRTSSNPVSPAQRLLPAGMGQYAPVILAVGALLLIWAIADL